jgi:indole-3-glycerol phosphate synthase
MMTTYSRAEMRSRALAAPPARDAKATLCAPGLSVVAEVGSPHTLGRPGIPALDPPALAAEYVAAGASCVSVLMQPRIGGSSRNDWAQVRSEVDVPLLSRDLVVDDYQLYEARMLGADMVRLIAGAVDPARLSRLRELAEDVLGMTAMIEIHDETELSRALDAGATVVGLNDQDPRTSAPDRSLYERMKAQLPGTVLGVAEPLLDEGFDLHPYRDADAILIGGCTAAQVRRTMTSLAATAA